MHDDETSKTHDSDSENVAIIHVIDEAKHRKQDFKCSISKLLKHMKYFEKSINGCEDKIGLDISVHCDLDTFEWLIKYIHLDRPIVHMNGHESSQDSTLATSQKYATSSPNNIYSSQNAQPVSKSGGMSIFALFDAISKYENFSSK